MNALLCILSIGAGSFAYEATPGSGDWLNAGMILFHQTWAILLYVLTWKNTKA